MKKLNKLGKLTVNGMIGLFIVILVGGSILGTAFGTWTSGATYNDTSLGTAGHVMWDLVPLFVVIAIIMGIIGYFRMRG